MQKASRVCEYYAHADEMGSGSAAAHNKFRGDGALVAYDENNEHLHVLVCNELICAARLCALSSRPFTC
jgi:hypothetical protein